MYNYWIELKTWCQQEKLLILSNFFFCHHRFKKQSAAETKNVYLRERDKHIYPPNSAPSVQLLYIDSLKVKILLVYPLTTFFLESHLLQGCQNASPCFQISQKERFLFLRNFFFPPCIQKAVCCRGVEKRLNEGKG